MAALTGRTHKLKCTHEHFLATATGHKTFELRFNDRDFKVGDILILVEWSEQDGFTGAELIRAVTYVLAEGPWLRPNYVALGLGDVAQKRGATSARALAV